MQIVWTVKSNGEIGNWQTAKTAIGAMRAARKAACNVIGATCALVGVKYSSGQIQETHKLGDYSIAESSIWRKVL